MALILTQSNFAHKFTKPQFYAVCPVIATLSLYVKKLIMYNLFYPGLKPSIKVWPEKSTLSPHIILSDGDGTQRKGFKGEWMTVKV